MRGRAAGHRRCGACLAVAAGAARRRQAGVARRHGHEWQDNHGEYARRHARGGRPSDDRRGKRRRRGYRGRGRRRTAPGARRGAVQLPALLECHAAPAGGGRAQRRTRSPRLAWRHGRLRRDQGADLRGGHDRHLQCGRRLVQAARRESGGRGRRRVHPRGAATRRSSGSPMACSPTVRSGRQARRQCSRR